MKTYLECGGSENIALKGAMLLYESRHRAFAVWHEYRSEVGKAVHLEEAQALTTELVRSLSQELRAELEPEVLPECVLVWNADLVVWWSPRCTRRMFFRNNIAAPTGFSGAEFSQPPLLWCVSGQELTVRALSTNRRPTAETLLMIAPYWNVDGDTGRVCLGSMKVPELAGVAALAQWEKAFFESEFTHQTGVKRLVQGANAYFDVWERVRSGPRAFPAKRLVPANETLSDLIRRCS
jgi:PRTRC genetic system protein B